MKYRTYNSLLYLIPCVGLSVFVLVRPFLTGMLRLIVVILIVFFDFWFMFKFGWCPKCKRHLAKGGAEQDAYGHYRCKNCKTNLDNQDVEKY